MLKNRLERTFYFNKEFHTRVEKKWYRDKIYRGMFEKTLKEVGIDNDDIKEAIENGWLIKQQIKDENGSYRNAYICTIKEMPQRETFKRELDKIYRFWKGEYEEYYG